ncbi:hypothetical protein AMTR_s00072p00073220 [Amborella trichopoda]|uniref:Uncharacterized protein n=1 Tax=Amborella trichopoda TaxID=13333 RepID=W1NS18_AMBTC|nr:hypothetical protein AMTR_s00072p00073220 [Amborella trichopoda]
MGTQDQMLADSVAGIDIDYDVNDENDSSTRLHDAVICRFHKQNLAAHFNSGSYLSTKATTSFRDETRRTEALAGDMELDRKDGLDDGFLSSGKTLKVAKVEEDAYQEVANIFLDTEIKQ